jgi:hypothetical protein
MLPFAVCIFDSRCTHAQRRRHIFTPWLFRPPRTLATFATHSHSSLLFFFHFSSRKSFSAPSWHLNQGLPIFILPSALTVLIVFTYHVFEGILSTQNRRNVISWQTIVKHHNKKVQFNIYFSPSRKECIAFVPLMHWVCVSVLSIPGDLGGQTDRPR